MIEINSARISDLDVWRAAHQIIKLYPDEPELAACQRAHAAYEVGDMFNFELWQRIAKAVREMLSKPSKEALLN
jgi:hypothetical protein